MSEMPCISVVQLEVFPGCKFDDRMVTNCEKVFSDEEKTFEVQMSRESYIRE